MPKVLAFVLVFTAALPVAGANRLFLGSRCATPDPQTRSLMYGAPDAWAKILGSSGADCNASSTNPDVIYDGGDAYLVDVWVHVITNAAQTQGVISDALIHSQIQILNEDFRALTGSNGANGTNSRIYFRLAGITHSANNSWFNDNQDTSFPVGQRWYYQQLAVDPHNFVNIYTNSAGGDLGYVPFLPADGGGGLVGGVSDRVVVLWDSFGRNAPIGGLYDQGRTSTHEVGHYLGLEHTFTGGCAAGGSPGCYSNGDLICDTNPEQSPQYDCPGGGEISCATPDPIENYMDYSPDLCMEKFSIEQTRRIRCSLENWRPNLGTPVLFYDGFESGDTSEWTAPI